MLEAFHSENLARQDAARSVTCIARLRIDGVVREVRGQGNGPIDAFVRALNQEDIASFTVLSYAEHSLTQGAEAQAAAYVQIQTEPGKTYFGAAIETNIELASVKAVLSALNRVL